MEIKLLDDLRMAGCDLRGGGGTHKRSKKRDGNQKYLKKLNDFGK